MTLNFFVQPKWFTAGLEAYASGRHFDAHELWEDGWRELPPGADRELIQGLIQVAAALHKARMQHKPAAAARILARGLRRLEASESPHRGLDVDRLLREGRQLEQQLLAAGDEPPADFPAELVVPTVALA